MEKLSLEEKAKRYDGAIERVKELLDSAKNKGHIIVRVEDIENAFPEIQESEEKKIRKVLIDYFNRYKEQGTCGAETFNGIPTDNILAWLEKQGKLEDKESDNELTWLKTFIEEEAYYLSMDIRDEADREKLIKLQNALAWLEKQGEQKPVDNVEPKFKVEEGKWYVCISQFCDCVEGRVYKATSDSRIMDDFGTECDMHSDAYKYFRLWTIHDAKDGDVLFHSDSASNGIFIFKEILQCGTIQEVVCYCDYDSEDGFCLGGKHTCCWTHSKILHPATKEQRDTLIKAMANDGYTFDFEKKELKKIESKTLDPRQGD